MDQENNSKVEWQVQQQILNLNKTYTEMISQEETKLKEIDTTIKKFEQQILAQKKDVGGVQAILENKNSSNKRVRILENRLNYTTQKYNSVVTENENLLREIGTLQQENDAFDEYANKNPKKVR